MKAELSDVKIPIHLYQMAIGEALQRLSPFERQAVGLRYLKDRTIAEVATHLGMSWDGADALIDRGLANMRRFLKGSHFEYKDTGPCKTGSPSKLSQDELSDLEDIYTDCAP